jgi:hypothetical protein
MPRPATGAAPRRPALALLRVRGFLGGNPADPFAASVSSSRMGKRSRRRTRNAPALAHLGAHGTGDRLGPVGEAWAIDGPIAELLALHTAESPEALQRVLVIPGRGADSLPDQAYWAFERAHGHDDTGMVETVMLATTNHRWIAVARPLLERLTDKDLLHDRHADQLTACFLTADGDAVPVTVPGEWLVDFYLQKRADSFQQLDPARTYTLHRQLSPQVRRWAAARRARDAGGIAQMLSRAKQLSSRHAAATILGLVDAAEHLDDAVASELLSVAAEWPATEVRLAALKRLAARGMPAGALDRAASDPAAKIRRWAARHRQIALPYSEPEQQELFT